MSALVSGKLEKCQYVTGADLGYKPGVAKKPEFKYSPLGRIYIKVLKARRQE